MQVGLSLCNRTCRTTWYESHFSHRSDADDFRTTSLPLDESIQGTQDTRCRTSDDDKYKQHCPNADHSLTLHCSHLEHETKSTLQTTSALMQQVCIYTYIRAEYIRYGPQWAAGRVSRGTKLLTLPLAYGFRYGCKGKATTPARHQLSLISTTICHYMYLPPASQSRQWHSSSPARRVISCNATFVINDQPPQLCSWLFSADPYRGCTELLL